MGEMLTVCFLSLAVNAHDQSGQVKYTPFPHTQALQTNEDMARMTVCGYVTAVDTHCETFEVSVAQIISCVPGTTPLKVCAFLELDEDVHGTSIELPLLRSVVSFTGDVMSVEHWVAFLSVNNVTCLGDLNYPL